MLKSLRLENVGPGPEMHLELKPRLNLLTGDNGLGKSFLLDTAWWALTRKWPREINTRLTSGYRAEPRENAKPARISFEVEGTTGPKAYTSTWDARDQAWTGKAGRPLNPGLVIYAHADGAFSVWDPARNYWRTRHGIDVQERLPAFVFSPQEVWDGLRRDDGRKVDCNGLIADLATWQVEAGSRLEFMLAVLGGLSPSDEPSDRLKLGPLGRLEIDDARPIPSIGTERTGYSLILHASSGVRRIAALGYVLLWTWLEHRAAAEKLGEEPTSRVTVLIDEIETHLHPRWQRSVLRSLIDLTREMHWTADSIQLVATTHSPLVLASVEPFFDAEHDAWFDLDLEHGQAVLRNRTFVRLGDATNWLTSNAFDLESGRSKEAGTAIAEARRLLAAAQEPSEADITRVDELIRNARLPDTDAFAARWALFVESKRKTA